MSHLLSKDGTRIGYETLGEGPPLVLVDGAFCHRRFGPMSALARRLAPHFRVCLYDRRGRGASGDASAYEVSREIEDLDAVTRAAGAPPVIYGTSSGAVLAARAVAAGVPAARLVIYEPPLALDGKHFPDPPNFETRIASLLAEGRSGDAVKLFMRVVGVPSIGLLFMRLIPGVFRSLKATAHTLPYDFRILGDTQRGGPLPEELSAALGSIRVPTLVLAGGKSPEYLRHASLRVAETIPGARLGIVEGQGHNVASRPMAERLQKFFNAV